MWNPFKTRNPEQKVFSITRLMGYPKRATVYMRDIISTIVGAVVGAVTGALSGLGLSFGVYAALSWAIYAIAYAAVMGVLYGISYALSSLSKKPSSGSLVNSGRVFNTKAVSEPIRPIYGEVLVGVNWVFCDGSGDNNKNLNVVAAWGEGEIEGVAKDIDSKPEFHGGNSSLNDMMISGTYVGAGYSLFMVEIDAEGTPDTFKWSDDYGATWEATGVAISGAWQNLNDGVKIKFPNTTGHNDGDFWYFCAGDGYWLGDKLMRYYENYNPSPITSLSIGKDLASQTLYTGSTTQTVDAALKVREPRWNDALRNTAYSIFELKWNDYAWQSIPELKATLKGLKVHDPSDPLFPADTPAYSRNPALCWLDLMMNKRYGLGIDAARIDLTSVTEAATWCTANGYYLDTALIDVMPFTDHLEDMLLNFRGFVTRSNGIYKLKVFSDDAAIKNLTDADFDLEIGVKINIPGIPELPNKVKCAFISREKHNQLDFASYEEDAVLAADGIERLLEIPLTGTSTYSQAKKLAKYHYLRARFATTYTMVGHPRCFNLEPGDMVNVTNSFLGWTAKKVRVANIGLPQEGSIPITFIQEDSSIYDQTVNTATEETWVSPAGDKTADKPTGLTVVETGYDESTWNKSDCYVDLSWTNPIDGTEFVLAYKKTTDTNWTTIKIDDTQVTPLVYRLRGLPVGITYDWKVRQKVGRSLSEFENGIDFTTYSPTGPLMDDVTFIALPEGSAVLLNWTKESSDFDIFNWIIYRNTVNDSATATVLDRKSRQTRSYRDMTVVTGTTYYYWLKGTDRFENESDSFSMVASIGFVHGIRSPVFETVGSGDVPAQEGALALIADTISLQTCDDYTDFSDDAADALDIVIEQETIDAKEGTGCLKITNRLYINKFSFEETYGDHYCLGKSASDGNRRYVSQGFKPTSNITCKAIGLKISKRDTPPNALKVDIYSDDGSGMPNASLISTTIAVANVPSSLPADYFTYAVFAGTQALVSGTLYHIVLDAQGYDSGDYYRVYGHFKNYGTTDHFGAANEQFRESADGSTWESVSWLFGHDPNDVWDMNFRICAATGALNKTVEATIAGTDISDKTYFKYWVKASRAGTNFQVGFYDATSGWQLTNCVIAAANIWEFHADDISAIAIADRDTVTKVGLKFTDVTADNIIYLDHIFCNVDYPRLKYYVNSAWRLLEKHLVEPNDDVLIIGAPTENSMFVAAYTKKKEIQVPCAGVYRVKFDMKMVTAGTGHYAYGRVYLNGVAAGPENESASLTYVTYTLDLLCAAGDLVQLYVKVAAVDHTCFYRDFNLHGDFGPGDVVQDD